MNHISVWCVVYSDWKLYENTLWDSRAKMTSKVEKKKKRWYAALTQVREEGKKGGGGGGACHTLFYIKLTHKSWHIRIFKNRNTHTYTCTQIPPFLLCQLEYWWCWRGHGVPAFQRRQPWEKHHPPGGKNNNERNKLRGHLNGSFRETYINIH